MSGRELAVCFRKQDCAACPLRAECTTSKRGRRLGVSKDYEQLLLDRQRADQPEFAQLYRSRAAVEATISQLVHRCGMRRSRYRTAPKRALHAVLAATALNVRRLLRCLGGSDVPRQAAPAVLLASATPLPRRLQRLTGAILASIHRCHENHADSAHSPA